MKLHLEPMILATVISAAAVLAGVVIGYWLNERSRTKERKIAYEGALYALSGELRWQEGVIRRLRGLLMELRRVAHEKRLFVPVAKKESIDAQLVARLRDSLLKYDHFDVGIINYCIVYANLGAYVNTIMDMSDLDLLRSHFADQNEYITGVIEYTDEVIAEMDKLARGGQELDSLIGAELNQLNPRLHTSAPLPKPAT